MLYVHPNGSADTHGVRFWNATPECCDFQTPKVDDQQYLINVIDQISAKYSVDPQRIYLIGHSNGGFMANAMACNHSDRIAAIVDIAGGNYGKLSLCKPSQPINVLQIWGSNDVTYSGNHILGKPIAGAIKTISYWAAINGCLRTARVSAHRLDLDSQIAGSETTSISFHQCRNSVSVEMWKIKGADHQPHFSRNFDELVIKFLLSHPRIS
jgi:polyhydroxybutyrate depolymerase